MVKRVIKMTELNNIEYVKDIASQFLALAQEDPQQADKEITAVLREKAEGNEEVYQQLLNSVANEVRTLFLAAAPVVEEAADSDEGDVVEEVVSEDTNEAGE